MIYLVVPIHFSSFFVFVFETFHPGEGTIRRILKKRYKGIDITFNFIDHFDHTVAAFRRACQSFHNQSQPITFSFREVTNKNVTVLGKLEV
mmetsp:Transcript_30221/g.44676  ORF Transcript_30221/g.44676 Transcript_30221/m.44676 type:complete len:91 (-) Transcript_30221:1726-1998(-)